jgi:hypothetical protein
MSQKPRTSRVLGAITIAVPLSLLLSSCERRPAPLSPPGTPAPAAAPIDDKDTFQIQWLSADVRAKMTRHERVAVKVSFKNTGLEPLSPRYLAISYHWRDAADPEKLFEFSGVRTAVPNPLAPGQTFTADVEVLVPDQTGRLLLEFDLVREGVAWFSNKGAPTSRHEVTVE